MRGKGVLCGMRNFKKVYSVEFKLWKMLKIVVELCQLNRLQSYRVLDHRRR